ncbi:hypothetical protein LTR62_007226 [Meristemomyces frigidus]|uniref:Rhodopsin domain-containing protein n=1 Tax=Meristemomyces frigidus TaxID=1508187 RepID=A0AAN7YDS0_9PEZI|nr:hypothetical protein LTR62_007226 [Meristemomyces frigidus]
MVWPLQITAYIKAAVILAFSFRLVCVVFAALHAVHLGRYAHATDPGLAIANVLVWQQVELGYALMAATILTLMSFIRGYNKAMGFEQSYSGKRGHGGGYNLDSYSR